MQLKMKKKIHSTFATVSSNDAFLEKSITLNSVPMPGMYISDGDAWDKVQDVEFNVSGAVVLYMEPDKTFCTTDFFNKSMHETVEFKRIIDEHIENGWRHTQ